MIIEQLSTIQKFINKTIQKLEKENNQEREKDREKGKDEAEVIITQLLQTNALSFLGFFWFSCVISLPLASEVRE